jgi:hypothetical protein
LNVTYKVFAKVLCYHLLHHAYATVQHYQARFQSGKSTTDQFFAELNFPTKLIRLTKATLTVVTCCVKIQKDCSESFETRQGLRQRDVLSTLLFNVVLEVIVRRANLQITGTIYNKETQLLAYADDRSVRRSLA